MLFHSSIRQEMARSFAAALVVLCTIVLTILLIRTLGLAARGGVNPQEILLVLGYTVLGRMPSILTLALFISVVVSLSRMYRESEMVIWMSSGQTLVSFIRPILRFAWPVLLGVAVLVLLVWPWTNEQTQALRDRFEQRGDIERIAPGQFQVSADGQRVFFIDQDTASHSEGRNIFISNTKPDGRQTITSARSGRIAWVNQKQMLILNNGQHLEVMPSTGPDPGILRVSQFQEYGVWIGKNASAGGAAQDVRAQSSWQLLRQPSAAGRAELGWRMGMPLAAFNFVLIALAATAANPRAARSGHLFFVVFAFALYYNLLTLMQGWVARERLSLASSMLLLHGTVCLLAVLWLIKRDRHFSLRQCLQTGLASWRGQAQARA